MRKEGVIGKEKGEERNIDFSLEDKPLKPRPLLDPSYNRPGDDSGPPRFKPQTSEFTLVTDDFYGWFMWRGGNGVLYLN